jgi:hypothetical protein
MDFAGPSSSVLISVDFANLAFFSGYYIFTRGDGFWNGNMVSWTLDSIGPWAIILSFLALVLLWGLRKRLLSGRWAWEIEPLTRIDLREAQAPIRIPKEEKISWWRLFYTRILNEM